MKLTILDVRPEVINFAVAMEKKLRKKDGYLGRSGWRDNVTDSVYLTERIREETKELDCALEIYDKKHAKKVQKEAVYVANFAMMIYDIISREIENGEYVD